MTTGSWTVGSFNTYGYEAHKGWTGSNSPGHNSECAYTCSGYRRTQDQVMNYNFSTGALVWAGYQNFLLVPGDWLWDSNDEIALLAKMTSSIRGHDFNAGIAGAEFHKTLDHMCGVAKSVFQLYHNVRTGNFQQALRSLGRSTAGTSQGNRKKLALTDLSDFWLSIQYGWKPMLTDIYEAAKWLEQRSSAPRETRLSMGSSKVSNWTDSAHETRVYSWQKRRQYRLRWSEAPSEVRTLGLTNPLSISWEVVPFSFVIDWFIPIGNYLDALSILSSLNASICRTTVYRQTWRREQYKCAGPGYSVPTANVFPHALSSCFTTDGGSPLYVHTHYKGAGESYQMSREVGVTISVPRPQLKSLEKAFSVGHIENAAALIWSLVGRAKK